MNLTFTEGVRAKGRFKNGRIFEGIVTTRADGSQVLYNESTRNWAKIDNFERIALVENTDNSIVQQKFNSFSDVTDNAIEKLVNDNADLSKMKDDDVQKVATNLTKITKANYKDIKDVPTDDKQAKDILSASILKAQSKNDKGVSSGDKQAAEQAQKEINDIAKKLGEAVQFRLHPLLREKNYINYEDDEYINISEGLMKKAIAQAGLMIDQGQPREQISDYIALNFEVTDDEVEDILNAAYSLYAGDIQNKTIQVAKEEIEKEMEKAIDEVEGDDTTKLDYLVQEFELDPRDTQFAYMAAKQSLIECIPVLARLKLRTL